MPLTCEEGKDPSLERPLIDMPLCAEHQERAPGVLRGQGGRHSRARGLHSQAWARGNGTNSSASANILPYITTCIGATCKRVAASFGPEAVLLVQPGAVEVFLDFISYSGGPLPEELLPQTTCPVSILWGEADPWEPIALGRAYADYDCVEEFIPLPGASPHLKPRFMLAGAFS